MNELVPLFYFVNPFGFALYGEGGLGQNESGGVRQVIGHFFMSALI